MELLGELPVPRLVGTEGAATIQLLEGDLSAIPPEHAVDVLVLSAFPDNYEPVPGTVVASLYERGLDMREVAQLKEEDERTRLGCWLSKPMHPSLADRFQFTRILCFEPRYPAFLRAAGIDEAKIEDTAGFVFRCLNNFVIPDQNGRGFQISRVAMPLLATGNQRVPPQEMFPNLLAAAAFWLEQGLPVEQLKIVVRRGGSQVVLAKRIFAEFRSAYTSLLARPGDAPDTTRLPQTWEQQLAETIAREVIDSSKRQLRERVLAAAASEHERTRVSELFELATGPSGSPEGPPSGQATAAPDYDVFVSYAHKQDADVKEFVDALHLRDPRPNVFYDRSSIPPGEQWIKRISDAVQRSRMFVAVLSPDYTASPVCWDEFQCAKLKEYNTRASVIKTIRLYKEGTMPPIMGIYSYVDCVEGDRQKLRDAADVLLA